MIGTKNNYILEFVLFFGKMQIPALGIKST